MRNDELMKRGARRTGLTFEERVRQQKLRDAGATTLTLICALPNAGLEGDAYDENMHQHHDEHDHGLTDSRRLVVAMENIARTLRKLVDSDLSRLTQQVNRSTDKLERAVKQNTPKK